MSTTEDGNQMPDPPDSQQGISRRSLLGAAAAGSAGALIATAVPASAGVRHGTGTPRRPLLPVHASRHGGTVLTLLGTSGGPTPDYVRTGISSVLTVGGRNYVVDAGRSSVTQYLNAGLLFSDLEAIFIGALHADHIADYYNYFLLAGMESSEGDELPGGPLTVYGPGSGGPLPPPVVAPPPPTTTIAPQDPTPGITAMTNQLNASYAYSNNIFIREQNIRPITQFTAGVQDINVPNVGASSTGNTAPNMNPFQIYEDCRVKVTATLVPLGLCYPSFAFRFDTDDVSVVFSQDNRPSQNLVTLAQGADVLVHEAIDYEFYFLRTKPRDRRSSPLLEHLRKAHTLVTEVGFIATKCDVGKLVLTHLSPSNPAQVSDARYRRLAKLGFKGPVIVGNDLDRIQVRPARKRVNRDACRRSQPAPSTEAVR
jgi:ribonuclease BN (tRNA processing enzyme)